MELTVSNGDDVRGIKFENIAWYFDHIVEIYPLVLKPGEKIKFNYKIDAEAYLNGELTDSATVSFTEPEVKDTPTTIRFFRVTKDRGQNTIKVTCFEHEPTI